MCNWWSGNINNYFLAITAQNDGSVAVLWTNALALPSTIYGQTGPGVIVGSNWNYIEAKVVFNHLAIGSCIVRVNGAVALNLTGIVTGEGGGDSAANFLFQGIGGGGTYIDDFYLNDLTGATDNDFEGAIRIYALLPNADSAPLEWAPSVAGSHFPLVNSVPIDPTKYVYDALVGDIDSYLYDASAIPAGARIRGVQHCLFASLDSAGSASVGSHVNGSDAPGGGAALTTTGHIYPTPWDLNPLTGLPWTAADIAAIVAGPKVTA
jgi:hypothetical protein